MYNVSKLVKYNADNYVGATSYICLITKLKLGFVFS